MMLHEMLQDTTYGSYQDERNDDSAVKFGDVRKTRLTLAQINLIRKMNDQRKVEYAQKLKDVKLQYGAAPAAPAA
jgi:transposase